MIERQYVIIGKALNQLQKADSSLKIKNDKKLSASEINWFTLMTALIIQLFG